MAIELIAIGTPEVLKRVREETERREKNTSDALIEKMEASAGEGTLEDWRYNAAEIQKIGYVKVKHAVFEVFGNTCPKNMTALKQQLLASAVAECIEKFADKHFFEEGRNLKLTLLRMGALHLLAKRVGRENFVSFSFGPLLASHGIPVPEWLELKREVPAPKHEERREHRPMERQRRGAAEMLKHFDGARIPNIRVNGDGSIAEILKVRKEIPILTAKEIEQNRLAKIAAKARLLSPKPAKKEEKKDDKKVGGKKGDQRQGGKKN